MTAPWPKVKLGEVLRRSDETIEPEIETEYREITVRLWGNGVTERGRVIGASLSGRRFVAHAGQFIASRIDARNGAMGLVPKSLEGAVVTNDFPLFHINARQLEPSFLGWLCRTRGFVGLCRLASEGTTNRVRLKEERFLSLEIPLPPLADQRRVVARIEALAAHLHEARTLRQQAAEEAETLINSASTRYFECCSKSHDMHPVGDTFVFRNDLVRPTDGVSGGIRFIGLQHVESNTGRKVGEDHIFAEELTGRKFKFSRGEIVYGYLRPYLNKVWVADCEGVCSVDQYVLTPRATVADTHFLAYLLRSRLFLQQAMELTHNLMLPRLQSGLLQGIRIPLPSLAEQRRIVEDLNALQAEVDALKRLQAETAAKLDALLPSILDKAFKGEL